jgi:predicted short-subunit dehydrogenase-like oxidoreductase (DUF2520 family)
MTKYKPNRSIAIIGPGRIGQAMGRLLVESGVPIAFVAARKSAAARRAVRFIGSGIPTVPSDPRLQSDSVLLITTSDSSVGEVARGLVQSDKGSHPWRGKVVLHTCGSLPSTVLAPLKLRGAAIGSLHPYQTVPSPQAGVRNLRGCFWALEGDRRALRVARGWVKLLGGVAFAVRPEKKTLYHLSAFIVCPTVVTLMAQSTSLLKEAGVPVRISRPMLRQFVAETAKNFVDLGARRALTGPAVRGDWATIRRHVDALRKSAPEFEPVYQSLLQAMLRLAGTESTVPGSSKSKLKVKSRK